MDAVLATAVGTHRELVPEKALQDHFDRIWIHAYPSGLRSTVHVVPDGWVDLVWVSGDLWIAGPDRTARHEPIVAGSSVVGLRFQPGAVERWLAVPSDAFVDQRVRLADLWGGEARILTEELAASDPIEVVARLQAGLGRRAGALGELDLWARELLKRMRRQVPVRGNVTTALAAELGTSERTLLRRTRAAFGYGPKFLQRVLRFQAVLRALRDAKAPGLSTLALAAGYADQAHFSRDAVELSGFTPTALIRQFRGRGREITVC